MPKDCLADLVHEIRGPLAPIATGLEILRLEIDEPELLAVLDMMRRQLDQLVEILNARRTRRLLHMRHEPGHASTAPAVRTRA